MAMRDESHVYSSRLTHLYIYSRDTPPAVLLLETPSAERTQGDGICYDDGRSGRDDLCRFSMYIEMKCDDGKGRAGRMERINCAYYQVLNKVSRVTARLHLPN
jgi:hypothetical protein